jgi:peptide/nickel transport system permease protein
MFGFLSRRALQSGFALVGLIVAVFFITRLTGDPASLYLPIDADLQARQDFNALHGFDQPLHVQFVRFLGDVLRGDFGMSLRYERPALQVVLEAYPTTLKLAFTTMTLVILFAVTFGAIAARRPGGPADRTISIASLAAASAPDFWVAITAILIFSVVLRVLPTSGYQDNIMFWILPVSVLMLRPFGLLVQVVRASMLNVLSSPYIRTARAKGVPESGVTFVHALRNACLSIVTVAGDQFVGMINGAVIVETIFGWPGIGKLMVDAVLNRDYALVQAAVMVTATAIFILFIVIDLIYVALDPRVRHQ